jgi:hypothetical protein
MSGTVWPCADISTTIARRSFTGSLAVRPICCKRRPSAIVTGRTKTSGGRPITTSGNSPVTSLAHPLEINDAQRSWPALPRRLGHSRAQPACATLTGA